MAQAQVQQDASEVAQIHEADLLGLGYLEQNLLRWSQSQTGSSRVKSFSAKPWRFLHAGKSPSLLSPFPSLQSSTSPVLLLQLFFSHNVNLPVTVATILRHHLPMMLFCNPRRFSPVGFIYCLVGALIIWSLWFTWILRPHPTNNIPRLDGSLNISFGINLASSYR
jgi:hypothetical protein